MQSTQKEVDSRLQSSWNFYVSRPMTDEEKRAALMLHPISAPLGLTEWRLTNGEVYAKGANAISAQVGINSRPKRGKAAVHSTEATSSATPQRVDGVKMPGDSVRRTQVWASGGGVQSAAIAALIVQGHLRPDLAIIVDTGREKSTTWAYMDSVITPALSTVGVMLNRVHRSRYEKRDLYGGKDNDTLLIPAFTNQSGEIGKLSNYCSSYWKREVVKRWANEQGVKAVDQWLGISVDEKRRVQKNRSKKWHTRYPLIERGLNRSQCVALVLSMGWPLPPRSSCWMCPNQTQEEWRDTRDNSPHDFGLAVRFDKYIRIHDPHAFVHSDCVPLDEANLDDANGVLFDHGCTSGECFV